MKAIAYSKYGPPDILQLKEVERPAPQDNEVLVRVYAASVNPLDWHYLRGTPLMARLSMGLGKPKNSRLGADVAGVVEAVGRNVKQFQPGDAVFGESRMGSLGEFVCCAEDKIEQKPANVTFEEAAAVCVAAVTALQGISDSGQLKPGQKVLINGASGGVGTFAVQIAKSIGAEVTGVCSTRNLEMVRSIGADHVIDYTQNDFTKNGQQYDLIIDNVGNRSVFDLKRALTPTGTCVIIGFSSTGRLIQAVLLGALVSKTGSQKIGLMPVANVNKKDMGILKELLETGKIVSVIDRRYPLSQAAEALRYLEEGHARGKVIVTVEQNNAKQA
jgi:NADPH:quinone reductase-like Zn-dependent oxidoreductase